MDSEANEATFEGLMDTETTGFDPNTITHAMITPDGQTVPITLNPETGQFMTPDGQTVQVQMAEEQEEQTFMEQDAETVLPDHGQSTSATEEVDMNIGTTSETSAFQVMETPQESQQQPTVVVKEENFSMIDQSANAGNIQVLSGDGSMYFVTDMAEAAPTIQMVNEEPNKIRIVDEPRKIITINNQQYIVANQSPAPQAPKVMTTPTYGKPKVVIRPAAIAPKAEPKVQYIKVVGSRPAQVQPNIERKVVTIRSGGTMPILPKETSNVLKIALPTTSSAGKSTMQRIILPSESVKVISDSAGGLTTQMSGPRKIMSLDPSTIIPKVEPSSIVTTTIETPSPSVAAEKIPDIFETSGVKQRKPCNCTKSQCLKLYCECFANGEFCHNCNCNNCCNNLANEEARQRSIKQCLERNPNAFRPKIGKLNTDGERRHNKGCNCKRSGCLKNYCECYEAKIGCTKNCRCIGCKNIEVAVRKPDNDPNASTISTTSETSKKSESKSRLHNPLSTVSGNAFRPVSGVRQPFNFVTNEVVEATCQCLLAQAEEAERSGKKEVEIEGLIIEEFGRCLSQIIEMANKSIC